MRNHPCCGCAGSAWLRTGDSRGNRIRREFQTAYAGFEAAVDRSVPLNQATYNVGRKISVRIVATSKPPMIAKAIGPQNTVGAIGIMPRTVDTAVSMIGRKRELLASMAASQTFLPWE